MGVAESTQLSEPLQWPAEGVTRIPYRLFSDEEIYSLEQERIFRGPVWNYLCRFGPFPVGVYGQREVEIT